MSSQIYTMYAGADPSQGWVMNDPIFGKRPTLGSCVPNIRRNVQVGDWIFFVSGRVKADRQYVVGGFQVEEKINQMVARDRFPELIVRRDESGHVLGNIIVNADGTQNAEDNHANFERRLENYLVGGASVELNTPKEFEQSRAETLAILSRLFGKEGNRPFDIIGRGRSMDNGQVGEMRSWLEAIKSQTR